MNKTQQGGEAMKKEQMQTQTQTQTQAQAQNQQETQKTQKGGVAMVYFITFPSKVDASKAKEVLAELRKRFPSQVAVFMPKPPPGKKIVIEIAGTLTIITFPYTSRQEAPMRETPRQEEGFTLKELIKK